MIDFLIIGQGLAGTTLAHVLRERKQSFHIADRTDHNSSTKVAAGLINPITGRRYVKSWMVDTFIPYAASFYKSLEEEHHTSFYHEMDIHKILANDEIVQIFNEKMEQEEMKGWKSISSFKKPETVKYTAKNIGSIIGARLDTITYLSKSLNLFLKENCFIEKVITNKAIEIRNNEIHFNGNTYKNLVFCEGYQLKDNEFFNYLPLNLCKGEVLTISGAHQLNGCYQKNNFIMPINDNDIKLGSNYEWKQLDDQPTEAIKETLLEKMDSILDFDYKVKNHQAGIRPTVKDRRPLMGNHPEHSNLFVFNGLGTKGVSLAPFMANHLADHIIDQKPLMEEVDIKRFN
jgi:glycine oxidase